MKYQTLLLTLLTSLTTASPLSPLPRTILLDPSIRIPISALIEDTLAAKLFNDPTIPTLLPNDFSLVKREDRNATTPDLLYVVHCTGFGFRDDCLVFGAEPGKCVSFYDFQAKNETTVSDRFDDQVTSMMTNTLFSVQIQGLQ